MDRNALQQIGSRIAERRKQMSLTQEKLAELMDVSIQMISNLERGNKAIKIDNLIRLCSVLQISTDYVLTGKRTETESNELAEKLSRLSDCDYQVIHTIIDRFIEEN